MKTCPPPISDTASRGPAKNARESSHKAMHVELEAKRQHKDTNTCNGPLISVDVERS